jgi:hypothetical protein
MNPQRSFLRKIVYLVALVGLLLVLSWLGQPSTGDAGGESGEQGVSGLLQVPNLADLRNRYHLSETQLGEIDPAGTTIKLATLGMRGVAANVLWEKANNYKMKKDWTNLSATLQQITRLEPHFVSVWRFQAWNLSYNVSAEFDDYRERYRWVIKGVDFLREGIRRNEREPMLVWDVGWYLTHKIGVADEAKQFRRLLKEDEETFQRWGDFRPVEDRDNWLVGKDWFARAEELVDKGADLRKTTPTIFFSHRPMSQMNYSEALEKDGIFEERARYSWTRAGKEWFDYGARTFTTVEGGRFFHLNDVEPFDAEAAKRVAALEAFEPGLREKIRKQRYDSLSEADRKAYDTPPQKRSGRDWEKAYQVAEKLNVTYEQVARAIKGQNARAALQLAREAVDFERKAIEIRSYRNVVNFEYWRRRAQFEQTPEALAARKHIYEGARAMSSGDLLKAREMYEKGFAQWRLLFDRKDFPQLKNEEALGQDLAEVVQQYRRVLDKSDKPFPKDFPLEDIMQVHEKAYKQRQGIK